MTLSAVAARYANALADVVTAGGSALAPQQAVAELHAFAAVLHDSADLHNALLTPAIAGSRKRAVVGRIGDVLQLSRITRNFLFVLLDHRRIASLPEIVRAFEETLDARFGFAQADIRSAAGLDEAEQRALTARLERLTGKRIRTRFTLDPSLVGGAVARIGSTIYDGSVRGQLAALERRLSAEG